MIAPIPKDLPDIPAVPVPAAPTATLAYAPAAAVIPSVRRPRPAIVRVMTALTAATGVTLAAILGNPRQAFSSFAVQSGVLVAVILNVSAHRAWTAARPLSPTLTGAALLYSMATALLHHTLTPTTPAPASAAVLLHTVTPIAVTLDWLLLTRPGALRLHHAALWLTYPVAYAAFALTFPTPPPYPFADTARHGYPDTLANTAILLLALYALALTLPLLDRLRPTPKTGFRLRPPVG